MVGQKALQVADPGGKWELEVYLRDDRVGHLMRAQQEQEQKNLPVTFALKSHSGETFEGVLRDIQETASYSEEHGHGYRVLIDIQKEQLLQRLRLEEPNQGAEVIAKIYCGRRSAAFCYFHELIEWVQIRLFAF